MVRNRQNLIASLDIGSSKICCFIAVQEDAQRPRIIGIGHQLSRGLKRGNVVDMDALELSILNAVHGAEQMAGETIRQVVVNVSGGLPRSLGLDCDIEVASQTVTRQDILRLRDKAEDALPQNEHHELIHFIPTSFSLDGHPGIQDPVGMYAQRIGAHILAVTAQRSALKNLMTCIEQCHLEVQDFVVSPYAAGLAVLMEDEFDLGATVIDMGGGVTSLAVFENRTLFYADTLPVGGQHVTNDIATCLSTPMGQAERLKTLYGAAAHSNNDMNEMIDVPTLGDDPYRPNQQVPKSYLTQIIQPRLEETFELIRQKLVDNHVYHLGGKRVVLAGGAAQLPGLVEMASRILEKNVRLGKPLRIAGLSEATGGPAFATCAGLIHYALQQQKEPAFTLFSRDIPQSNGLFDRFSHWLQSYF